MPDDAKKPTAFQAAQPTIPGVPARAAEKPASNQQPVANEQTKGQPPYLWAAGGGAILMLIIALVWWAHSVTRAARVAPVPAAPPPVARPAAPPQPVRTIPVAPGTIATTSEMKEPWSTKKFLYRNPGGDTSPALLVHLPGNSYWAFSLREPYGTCELEFASVEKLRSDYNLAARYPMVGDPCTRTVYDLMRYGAGPNGLVRGAVVAGVGVRPPLAIEVQVQDRDIVASRSE
ncbi:MAG: hypothetical protein WBE86_07990 [Candidatus Acidiferrales bacterium]